MFKVKHKFTDEILTVVHISSSNADDSVTTYQFLCVDEDNNFVTTVPNEVIFLRNRVKSWDMIY